MATSFIAQRKLSLLVIIGLLLGSGIYQVIFVIVQFNPNLLQIDIISDIISVSHLIVIMLMSIGVITLILIEINNLQEFNIDKFAIITFILGLLLFAANKLTGVVCSPVIGTISIVTIIVFLVRKPNTPRTDLRWALIGVLFGSVAVILITILEIYIRPEWFPYEQIKKPTAGTAVGVMLRQISDISWEELLFRGFLWGYLRQYGWKENKIIWTQGLLFWFLHFGKIFISPFTFFVAVPIVTLISSKLTAYSKQTYPSILSHVIINTIGGLLNLSTF